MSAQPDRLAADVSRYIVEMRHLSQVTDGKALTLASMHPLIENTRIRESRVRGDYDGAE